MIRPFGSIVVSMLYAFTTLIAGAVPVNAPVRTAAAAGPASQYTPEAPCQFNPSQPPAGWPASPPYQPFSQTFTNFLSNTLYPAQTGGLAGLSVSQVSRPMVTTPRKLDLTFQLLYNKQFPGPTIRVPSELSGPSISSPNNPITATTAPPGTTQVSISNALGAPSTNVPVPYITTHLHGGHTPPEHDGHPDDLLPPQPATGSSTPTEHIYTYTNDQQPQILWYHDHADANTSPHVSEGLFAFYIIEENASDPSYPYLPKEPYDIPLGLQVLTAGVDANQNVIQFASVNGVDSPYLNVEPRWYRFRVLNASATQSISLELCTSTGQPISGMWVIGTDGGLLKNPVNVVDRPLSIYQDGRLDVYQAERYDLLIDFSQFAGQSIYMGSVVRDANGCSLATNAHPPVCNVPFQETAMMQFNVTTPLSPPPDTTNLSMIGDQSWDTDTAFLHSKHTGPLGQFSTRPDHSFNFENASGQFLISGQPYDMFRLTMSDMVDELGNLTPYPATINPMIVNANSVQIWELRNTVNCAAHPVHVHDIEFQIVEINGHVLTPEENAQIGWKDIFVLPPVYNAQSCPWVPNNPAPSIKFIGYYESHWVQGGTAQIGDTIPWLQTSNVGPWTALTSGTYVFHCHNLNHEDNAMMGQWQVVPPPFIVPLPTPTATPTGG